MRKEKKLNIDSLGEITVRELTVAQVTGLMEQEGERPFYAIEAMMVADGKRLPLEAVALSCGLDADRLNGDIAPSDAALIWDAAMEVNPFLSRLLERFSPILPSAGQLAQKS